VDWLRSVVPSHIDATFSNSRLVAFSRQGVADPSTPISAQRNSVLGPALTVVTPPRTMGEPVLGTILLIEHPTERTAGSFPHPRPRHPRLLMVGPSRNAVHRSVVPGATPCSACHNRGRGGPPDPPAGRCTPATRRVGPWTIGQLASARPSQVAPSEWLATFSPELTALTPDPPPKNRRPVVPSRFPMAWDLVFRPNAWRNPRDRRAARLFFPPHS